jgi:hypothetical protein
MSIEHVGPIVPSIATAGCHCHRCEYLRETPGTGPDHVGAYTLDTLDPSNAGCGCLRCVRLRASFDVKAATRYMPPLDEKP